MKYKLIPKANILTSTSPEEHKKFALMDKNQKVSIARELQSRHLFIDHQDLLDVTEEQRNIYFFTIPKLDKPTEPLLPKRREPNPIFIKADHKTSRTGMKVEM